MKQYTQATPQNFYYKEPIYSFLCLLCIVHAGECCGVFQQTYGAKYGKGSQLCGTYMYNEIVAAGGYIYNYGI